MNTKTISLNDHTHLINKSLSIIENHKELFTSTPLSDSNGLTEIGYNDKSKNNSYLVLKSDTALELGSPNIKSQSSVMYTKNFGFLSNRLWLSGKNNLKPEKEPLPFLLLILLEADSDIDQIKFKLKSIKNLNNKIPGFMTKSFSGNIWVRIHSDLLEKGFTLQSYANALFKAYKSSIPQMKNMDIIMVTKNTNLISEFDLVCEASEKISANNKKIRWERDGLIECETLDCNTCDEQIVCDLLKEVISEKRSGA